LQNVQRDGTMRNKALHSIKRSNCLDQCPSRSITLVFYTALYEGGGYCGTLVGSYGSVGAGVDLGGGTRRGGGDGGGAGLDSA
jgi:hypothetical protein